MKNKQHLRITLLLAFALCLICILGLSSCGEKLTSMYVAKSDLPRLDYVEGQELDLSNGVITVVGNEGERKVPFTDPTVIVTGYDKNTIGQQTLTIQYGDLSTSITVNVIPRMSLESFESRYFVHDIFNKEIGKIKIAKDNTETFTVNMSDERVQLVSFDSSKAGNATVTVRYTDDAGSYDCQFNVTVYEPSNIKFNAPTKKTYLSHDETGPSVEGGFFTVVSNDGKLTKHVPLSTDHIVSFDLSAATINNRTEETAFEQVVKVSYLGFEDEYKIDVIFSGVSVLKYYTNPADNGLLTGIDWSSDTDLIKVLTEEQITAAIDALTTYYALSDKDKALISDASKEFIVRASSVAAFDKFLTELKKFENTIRLENDPEKGPTIFLPCKSFEQTRDDIKIISDSNAEINKLAVLLRSLEADFGETVIQGEVTVKDYVYVYSDESQNSLVNLLIHLVDAFEPLADVPTNWTLDDLVEQKDDIISSTLLISSASYYEDGLADYYTGILSRWREKNDFFEIIYSYFVYKHEDNVQFMADYMFGQLPMLGKLETWYNNLNEIIKYENFYAKYFENEAYLSDVSVFMFYYFQILELSKELKNSDNQLIKDIYKTYDIDYMNRFYTYTYTAGFMYHARGQIDSEAFYDLWMAYYEVLKIFDTNELSAETHEKALVAMVDAFEALSPSELFGFLSSLNLMYNTTDGSVSVLTYTEEEHPNIFCFLLREYYSTYLTEAAKPLMLKLLSAMENFALIGIKADALEVFQSTMAELINEYAALPSDADRDSFDIYLGDGYKKYLAIYNVSKALVPAPQLSAEEIAMIERLRSDIEKFNTVFSKISNTEQISTDLFGVICALYSNINDTYTKFRSEASEEALIYLYEKIYEISGKTNTLESAFFAIDDIMTSIMLSQSATIFLPDGTSDTLTVWELYSEFGASELISYMADLLYYGYSSDEITLQKDYVDAVISKFNGSTMIQRSIFSFLGVDSSYYKSLKAYYKDTLTDSGAKMAEKLLDADAAYRTYLLDSTNEEKNSAFTTLMEYILANYAAVADSDKEYLNGIYDHCAALYDEFTADTETQPEV